jgi:hypothetical protein
LIALRSAFRGGFRGGGFFGLWRFFQ